MEALGLLDDFLAGGEHGCPLHQEVAEAEEANEARGVEAAAEDDDEDDVEELLYQCIIC